MRQPVAELIIRPDTSMNVEALKGYEQHIKEELNVKKVTFVDDESALLEYELKIDFKKLGPKFGKDVPLIQKALQNASALEVVRNVRAGLDVEVELNGRKVTLEPEEIVPETKPRENFVVMEENGSVLGLDTHLTPELLSEGLARDLVRHIQELRKEADFEMNDRIHLFYEGDTKFSDAFTENADYIKNETLALDISDSLTGASVTKDVKLSGDVVKIGVKKS